jgi:hypothetical protein
MFPLTDRGEVSMSRIVSIVVRLDNGKYRALDLSKVRSIHIDPTYASPPADTSEDEGGLAGPETDAPDFSPTASASETTTRSASTAEADGDNGDPPGPNCYWVNGAWICL